MKKLNFFISLIIIISCSNSEEDFSYARRLAEQRLSEISQNEDQQNNDSTSTTEDTSESTDQQNNDSTLTTEDTSESTDQQNNDSTSTTEDTSESTDQQNNDSAFNNTEIGFANLNFDEAINSEINIKCQPLEIDGLFFYYGTEFEGPPKQIIFDLIPESLKTLSNDIVGYEKVMSPKNYYNYSLYLLYDNDKINTVRLINTTNREVIKEISVSTDLNASDILHQIADYIIKNIENLKTDSSKKSEIEDGIYKYTFVSSNLDGYFDCKKAIMYSSQINQNGDNLNEFFKITNDNLTGYIIRDPNSQIQNEVWDLSSKLINDQDINMSVNFSSFENFSNNELIHLNELNSPIKLVLKTNNNGNEAYKTYLLEKVNQLGFNALDSFENIGFYSDEIYSQIDVTDPSSYLSVFILDAQRHNIDLSYIDNSKFQFELVDENHPDLSGFRAVAMRGCNNDEILIKYSRPGWVEDTSNPFKKSFPPSFGVMWHEFGHDILNLKHLCLGGHIMSGRHQDPQILNSQSECNTEYITTWSMKWDHPNQDYDIERAVDNLFDSGFQIPYECN